MKPEIYKDEGYKLTGAAFEVYNERGYGMGEKPSSTSTIKIPFSGHAFPRISRIHTDSRNGTENIRNSSLLRPALGKFSRYSIRVYSRYPRGTKWQRLIISEFIPPSAKISGG